MFRRRARLRRLLLGATVATCSLAGLYGGSASALNLNTSTDTNLTIDGDTHSFQGNLVPVTRDGYQYFAYWDAVDPVDGEVYLMLTRRRLSDDNLVTLRFDGTGGSTAYPLELTAPMDGHNYVGLGISPNDSRLHLSWSLHTPTDRRHRYLKSATGCLGQTQANFTFANCRFEFAWAQVDRQVEEDRLTYPTYFNDSRGRLYFAFRFDHSARGDEHLNSYNDDGSWTRRGVILRGRRDGMADRTNNYRFDPDGAGPEREEDWVSVQRGPYIQEWEFDSRDRLHALWVWREDLGAPGQHGLNYVYSDDFGRTWYYENAGRSGQIGTAGSDFITIIDRPETQVVGLPPGWAVGQAGFELDSNGNPHMFVTTSDFQSNDPLLWTNRQTHIWRRSDKTWQSQFVEPRGDVRQGRSPFPGDIFFDHADNAYALFARKTIDWEPYNRRLYEQAELPYENVTWQPESGTDGLLDVQLHSAITCLDSADNIALTLDTSGNNQVRFRLRNDTDSENVNIWWATESSPDWDAARLQTFTRGIRARSGWTDYTFTINDTDWTGTLRSLEICFAGDPDNRGSHRIDWIDVYNSSTRRAAKLWDFLAPYEMYAAEASQADNWATWRIEELFPGDGVYVTGADGYWFQDTQRYKDSGRVEFNIHQQGSPGNERLSLRSFRLTRDDVIKDWRFDADAMGWTAYRNGHVRDFAWRDEGAGREKGISGGLNGRDPALLSAEALDVPINSGRYLHVVMKNTSAARLARVWFRTATDRTWTTRKSAQFAITANSGYTPYSIDMQAAGMDPWDRQLLYQIEIDPSDDATVTGTFVIDRIWIDNTR